MPNGRGSLDCCYCVHFEGTGYPDGHGEERRCHFHQTVLPKATADYLNRICCHFDPNETYELHNGLGQFAPLVRRFAWFGVDLEPGVLYEYSYPHPPSIAQLKVLRIPDYENDTWQTPTD